MTTTHTPCHDRRPRRAPYTPEQAEEIAERHAAEIVAVPFGQEYRRAARVTHRYRYLLLPDGSVVAEVRSLAADRTYRVTPVECECEWWQRGLAAARRRFAVAPPCKHQSRMFPGGRLPDEAEVIDPATGAVVRAADLAEHRRRAETNAALAALWR